MHSSWQLNKKSILFVLLLDTDLQLFLNVKIQLYIINLYKIQLNTVVAFQFNNCVFRSTCGINLALRVEGDVCACVCVLDAQKRSQTFH